MTANFPIEKVVHATAMTEVAAHIKQMIVDTLPLTDKEELLLRRVIDFCEKSAKDSLT